MQTFINAINNLLTGPVMVWGILFVGIILSFKTGFIQVTKLKEALLLVANSLFKKSESKNGITPFQAVTTALAGTIGTGNIVGVATAISVGGAGAIFWMWVSAFFGMATKYAEIVLAIKFRQKQDGHYVGGPMYYLKQAFKSGKVSACFAVLCILSSFGIGNIVQSNSISSAILSVAPIDPRPIIIVIAILVGFVIIGGIKRIARITESVIPFMAAIYILACVIIISLNYKSIIPAFNQILSDAFAFNSISGGIAGFFTSRAVRIGFARGVFTNEAGLGSAPIAHAAADAKSPASQGLMGVFEVFFDTIIMCTMTAMVIIISGLYKNTTLDGASLTLSAFSKFLGSYAELFIAIATIFFAVATIIGWSYYGESCINYLCKSKCLILIYKTIYIFSIYFGAVTTLDMVWGISDIFNGLMMIPNLIGIVMLSSVVRDETRAEFSRSITNHKKT